MQQFQHLLKKRDFAMAEAFARTHRMDLQVRSLPTGRALFLPLWTSAPDSGPLPGAFDRRQLVQKAKVSSTMVDRIQAGKALSATDVAQIVQQLGSITVRGRPPPPPPPPAPARPPVRPPDPACC